MWKRNSNILRQQKVFYGIKYLFIELKVIFKKINHPEIVWKQSLRNMLRI